MPGVTLSPDNVGENRIDKYTDTLHTDSLSTIMKLQACIYEAVHFNHKYLIRYTNWTGWSILAQEFRTTDYHTTVSKQKLYIVHYLQQYSIALFMMNDTDV